jgi:hypothetical protein
MQLVDGGGAPAADRATAARVTISRRRGKWDPTQLGGMASEIEPDGVSELLVQPARLPPCDRR